MIVVKIELHSAVTGQTTELGKMIIANDGSGTQTRGNYNVKLGRRGVSDLRRIYESPQRLARVELFPRQAFSVWVLVARALKNLGIERFADFFEKQTSEMLEREGL